MLYIDIDVIDVVCKDCKLFTPVRAENVILTQILLVPPEEQNADTGIRCKYQN